MDIPNTPGNVSYAASVNARIDAETARVRRTNMLMAAKVGLWRAAGCGLVIVALGVATGLAFVGYSFISDKRSSLDQLTAAFAAALQATTLHADGVVGFKKDATVALADGSHVTLDPSSVSLAPGGMVSMNPGTVNLAPGSTVAGRPNVQDMVRKMQQIAVPDRRESPALEFDDVVAFHVTDFKKGQVTTGWRYHAADGFTAPYHQFCYYREPGENSRIERDFVLATDGQLADDLGNPFNVDMHEAFKLCDWHS